MPERMIERRWESTTLVSRAVRLALTPLSWLYGAAVAARNAAYDRGLLARHALGLPTVSIGNLTVGGTGKTPLAAWFAARFVAAGARPAILLRGYGDDEPLVHRHLVPDALVVPGADRVASAGVARARGASVLILDDGFQHRRARRDADVVLVSADRHRTVRLLPAGPWREPVRALRRASHVIVTRKRSTPLHAREVAEYVHQMAPQAQLAIVYLEPTEIVSWTGGERRPAESLAPGTVLAISAIGDPRAFEAQLRATGARVAARPFRDHHAFTSAEVARLAAEARGADVTVCTLKDAVKLGPIWPASAPPLWYLSLQVRVEQGAEGLEALVRDLVHPDRT